MEQMSLPICFCSIPTMATPLARPIFPKAGQQAPEKPKQTTKRESARAQKAAAKKAAAAAKSKAKA